MAVVLEAREDEDRPDRIISATDPDARTGWHGGYYDGYQLDILVDPDSEIITALDTLPANNDEAGNTENLTCLQDSTQSY
jgi:hypothetical protein